MTYGIFMQEMQLCVMYMYWILFYVCVPVCVLGGYKTYMKVNKWQYFHRYMIYRMFIQNYVAGSNTLQDDLSLYLLQEGIIYIDFFMWYYIWYYGYVMR